MTKDLEAFVKRIEGVDRGNIKGSPEGYQNCHWDVHPWRDRLIFGKFERHSEEAGLWVFPSGRLVYFYGYEIKLRGGECAIIGSGYVQQNDRENNVEFNRIAHYKDGKLVEVFDNDKRIKAIYLDIINKKQGPRQLNLGF